MTKKRKKKHNKIIALAKSKLNMIDTLLSNALNDSKINHEEYINEKNIYENIKENIKDTAETTADPTALARSSLEHIINRTEADKVLRDKAYDIASNSEYDGYQRGLASMV